ncbi:hypothetical protein KY362_04310 [Candidatus Woesearchaeota archaeon]|nr:hypothetical protein [Candidatus Woesearchaeota archaeon]
MEETQVSSTDKKIGKADHKRKAAGIKGEVLHPHIRYVIERRRFRYIHKGEKNIDKHLNALRADVQKHLVVNAEKEEEKTLKAIASEFSLIYLALHSLHLYERYDIQEMEELIKQLKKKLGKLDDGTKAKIEAQANDWLAELDKERKIINAIYKESEGGQGFALTMFKHMHKDNVFTYVRERMLFNHAKKSEKFIEADEKIIRKAQDGTAVMQLLEHIEVKTKRMADDFRRLWMFIGNSWETVITKIAELEGIVLEATKARELPQVDAEQIPQFEARLKALEKDLLHGLRIELKQLTADVDEEMSKAN